MTDPYSSELEDAAENRAWNIGKCQKCQYFDVERDEETPTDETLAPCLHPDMEEFELVVSGDSGCNLFEICEDIDDDDDVDEEAPSTDESRLEEDL